MMQRSFQQLVRPLRNANAVCRRGFFGPPAPWSPRGGIFDEFNHRVNQLERELFRSPFFAWRPFQNAFDSEVFRLRNPIIEEDGVKKFKLEFDVRRFKPEDVKVSTDAKEGTLTIEAKYKDAESSFEYSRKVSIPEGVDAKQITAKYTGEGSLVFEAPYTEPPKPELPKEQKLEIDHK
uniref:Heat shock protein 20 n=1 Tax=Bursaphelenchus doui TaxID=359799 RepID=F5A185_9BILA|nr:heat shock protein 20 [Bursaphelenchus doui]